jgi:hypothetical protein
MVTVNWSVGFGFTGKQGSGGLTGLARINSFRIAFD